MFLIHLAACASYVIKETFLMGYHLFLLDPVESVKDLLGFEINDDYDIHTSTSFIRGRCSRSSVEQTPIIDISREQSQTITTRAATTAAAAEQTLSATAASISVQAKEYSAQSNQTDAEGRNNFSQVNLIDENDGDPNTGERVDFDPGLQTHDPVPERLFPASPSANTGTTPILLRKSRSNAQKMQTRKKWKSTKTPINEDSFLSHVASELQEQQLLDSQRSKSRNDRIFSNVDYSTVNCSPADVDVENISAQPTLSVVPRCFMDPNRNRNLFFDERRDQNSSVQCTAGSVTETEMSSHGTVTENNDFDSLGWFFGLNLSDRVQGWMSLMAYLLVFLFLALHLVFILYHHYTIQAIRSSYNSSASPLLTKYQNPFSSGSEKDPSFHNPQQIPTQKTAPLSVQTRKFNMPGPGEGTDHYSSPSDNERLDRYARRLHEENANVVRKCGTNCPCKHGRFFPSTDSNLDKTRTPIEIESHRCQYLA